VPNALVNDIGTAYANNNNNNNNNSNNHGDDGEIGGGGDGNEGLHGFGFVDALLSRVLTEGIFRAVAETAIEIPLLDQVEAHTLEASEASVAARADGISPGEREALLRAVNAHRIDREMLEEKVRVLYERLDEHAPLHAAHEERHTALQAQHAALRDEHETLKKCVAELTAAAADASASTATPAAVASSEAHASSSVLAPSTNEGNDHASHVAALSSQLGEARAAQRAHAAELEAERKARAAMEAQLNQLHLRVEDLVRQLGASAAAAAAAAGSTSPAKPLTRSAETEDETPAQQPTGDGAAAAAFALKQRLAGRRNESTAGVGQSPRSVSPSAVSSVKAKLAERRRAKEAEDARTAQAAIDARRAADDAAAAEAAAALEAKSAANEERTAGAADAIVAEDEAEKDEEGPSPRRQLTRRKSAVMLLVPNPQWDAALLAKHPMEGLAKFLRTNRFRVVDLFNAMDKDKDG
jgi:hypothetical protein